MKEKNNKPYPAPQVHTHFSIRDICGSWVSSYGSPDIKIFHDGSRFRLTFYYKQDVAFTVDLCQSRREGIFFNFYGKMQIAYDDEQDLLLLTTEGEYTRVYD